MYSYDKQKSNRNRGHEIMAAAKYYCIACNTIVLNGMDHIRHVHPEEVLDRTPATAKWLLIRVSDK